MNVSKLDWTKCDQTTFTGKHLLFKGLIVHDLGEDGVCIQPAEGDGSEEQAIHLVKEINKLMYSGESDEAVEWWASRGIGAFAIAAEHDFCSLSRPAYPGMRDTYCALLMDDEDLNSLLEAVEKAGGSR